MKVALIKGIKGRDGSYLAEFLLEKGHEVRCIMRRASSFNTQRIGHDCDGLHASETAARGLHAASRYALLKHAHAVPVALES